MSTTVFHEMRAPRALGGDLAGAGLAAVLDAPRSLHLRVPATSANLGPGYDCMGLALCLHDDIDVVASPREEPEQPRVSVLIEGQGAEELPRDASHLVVALTAQILRRNGFQLPDLAVSATNRIPHSRGLGSSAAAVASAVVLADALLPVGLSAEEQLQIGAQIEGHPDNYAPALRGGVALSWQETDHVRTAPLVPHENLRTVLAVPNFVQSTAEARDVLPRELAHAAAAANSARTGLLVHALTTAPELLLPATVDLLHQDQRRSSFESSMALVDSLRAVGHAAVISGAGPAVLVLTDGDGAAAEAEAHIAAHEGQVGDMWRGSVLRISASGATVEEHQR